MSIRPDNAFTEGLMAEGGRHFMVISLTLHTTVFCLRTSCACFQFARFTAETTTGQIGSIIGHFRHGPFVFCESFVQLIVEV